MLPNWFLLKKFNASISALLKHKSIVFSSLDWLNSAFRIKRTLVVPTTTKTTDHQWDVLHFETSISTVYCVC